MRSSSAGSTVKTTKPTEKKNLSETIPDAGLTNLAKNRQTAHMQNIGMPGKSQRTIEEFSQRSKSVQSQIPDYWLNADTDNKFSEHNNDVNLSVTGQEENDLAKLPRPSPIFVHGAQPKSDLLSTRSKSL